MSFFTSNFVQISGHCSILKKILSSAVSLSKDVLISEHGITIPRQFFQNRGFSVSSDFLINWNNVQPSKFDNFAFEANNIRLLAQTEESINVKFNSPEKDFLLHIQDCIKSALIFKRRDLVTFDFKTKEAEHSARNSLVVLRKFAEQREDELRGRFAFVWNSDLFSKTFFSFQEDLLNTARLELERNETKAHKKRILLAQLRFYKKIESHLLKDDHDSLTLSHDIFEYALTDVKKCLQAELESHQFVQVKHVLQMNSGFTSIEVISALRHASWFRYDHSLIVRARDLERFFESIISRNIHYRDAFSSLAAEARRLQQACYDLIESNPILLVFCAGLLKLKKQDGNLIIYMPYRFFRHEVATKMFPLPENFSSAFEGPSAIAAEVLESESESNKENGNEELQIQNAVRKKEGQEFWDINRAKSLWNLALLKL